MKLSTDNKVLSSMPEEANTILESILGKDWWGAAAVKEAAIARARKVSNKSSCESWFMWYTRIMCHIVKYKNSNIVNVV